MFVITLRSIAFSIATLFTVLPSTVSAQGGQPTSDPSTSQPANQSGIMAGDNDDADLVLAEPDFQERYSPALGVAVSRMFADRLAVYATPVWVHNTAGNLNVDRDTFFVGIGGRVRVSATVYLVGEVAPRAGGYSPDKPAFGFAVEKRAGGHLFQLNVNNGQGTTFAQLARGGFADSLYLGFNLARKFF